MGAAARAANFHVSERDVVGRVPGPGRPTSYLSGRFLPGVWFVEDDLLRVPRDVPMAAEVFVSDV